MSADHPTRTHPRGPAGADRLVLGILVKVWPKLSETFILEEVLGLERLGLRLCLYALAAPTDALRHAAVHRVQARVRVMGPAPDRAADLAQQLQDDGVTHLHCHFISATAELAVAAAAQAGIPLSISAHAKDIYLTPSEQVRFRLAAAAFTLTCTEANRAHLAALAPTAAIHRMYHGIDAEVFRPRDRAHDSGPPLVLAVGRLRAKKGFDTLIDACARLHAQGRSLRCEIVGYGEEQAALQARIDAAGLGARVRLVGALTRDALLRRYAQAAVFVQASRIADDGDRDGIPNVLLEAMASERAVIATRVSGIPEILRDDDNGLLIDADAPAALAGAIDALLSDGRRARALGRRARQTVLDQFNNDRNLQLLVRLLRTPRAPHRA